MTNIEIMSMYGKKLRDTIFDAKNTHDPAVLNSIVYRLLNAIKSNYVDDFIGIVIKTCCGYKISVPTKLLEVIQDHEKFADYAYAYILGIETPYYEKEQNNAKEGNDNL